MHSTSTFKEEKHVYLNVFRGFYLAYKPKSNEAFSTMNTKNHRSFIPLQIRLEMR